MIGKGHTKTKGGRRALEQGEKRRNEVMGRTEERIEGMEV